MASMAPLAPSTVLSFVLRPNHTPCIPLPGRAQAFCLRRRYLATVRAALAMQRALRIQLVRRAATRTCADAAGAHLAATERREAATLILAFLVDIAASGDTDAATRKMRRESAPHSSGPGCP